jgi:hypothetical protein
MGQIPISSLCRHRQQDADGCQKFENVGLKKHLFSLVFEVWSSRLKVWKLKGRGVLAV